MPKATTSKSATHFKPYDRSSQTPPSDDGVSQVDDQDTSPKKAKAKEASPFYADKHTFTRVALVTLIFAPAKPNWDAIARKIGKTKAQTYDLWRKALLPNLLSNKAWSSGSNAEVKVQIMLAVLAELKPDWTALSELFYGKSKTQIFDSWRKAIVPRLRRGETIE